MMKKITLIITIFVVAVGLSFTSLYNNAAEAISFKNFDPGNIIDDATFYDSGSMSAGQVQSFLNKKVPNCDTQGSGPYKGTTVNKYWTPNGEPAPYTCLKDWKQNTPKTNGTSGLCSYMPKRTNRSGAEIIVDIAKACGVSPKVLLVLLEKEKSLVTDRSPLSHNSKWSQYKYATGFGCPDTAPCNPEGAGFFNQVYSAAYQFKLYRANPKNYNYIAHQSNYIQYNPSKSCGGSYVTIKNQATAGLYNYTPYQPNKATLAVPAGVTAKCGAYGNKNFWYLFTMWFGSTHTGVQLGAISFAEKPFTDNFAKATFKITNKTSKTQDIGSVNIVVRDAKGKNLDYPLSGAVKLKPGESYTYSYKPSSSNGIGSEGEYSLHIGRYKNGKWTNFEDLGILNEFRSNMTYLLAPSPQITTSLKVSSDSTVNTTYARQDQPLFASYTVKNPSSKYNLVLDNLVVAGRDPKNKPSDFPSSGKLTLKPGASYTYNKSITPKLTGGYSFWVSYNDSKYGWDNSVLKSLNSSIVRSMTKSSKTNPTVTSNISLSTGGTSSRTSDTLIGSFKVKNHGSKSVTIGPIGLAGRTPNNKPFDMDMIKMTLAPGEEKTYISSKTLPEAGTYSFWMSSNRSGIGWDSSYPSSESSSIKRSATLTAKDSVTVIESPKIVSSSAPALRIGDSITSSFKIKNFSSKSLTVGPIGLAGRDPENKPFDMDMKSFTLAPGETKTYISTKKVDKIGKYLFWISSNRKGIGWDSSYPAAESGNVSRSTNAPVASVVNVTKSVSLSKASDNIVGSFKIKNYGSNKVTIGPIGLAGRDPENKPFDMDMKTFTLSAGQEVTYTSTKKLSKKGAYSFWVSSNRLGAGWDSSYPTSLNSTIARSARVIF